MKQELTPIKTPLLDDSLIKLLQARHHDPFAVLGRHEQAGRAWVRILLPHAKTVRLGENGPQMVRLHADGLFEWHGNAAAVEPRYWLVWEDQQGNVHRQLDPYSFTEPLLPEYDLYLFNEGKHWQVYEMMGAQPVEVDGIRGIRFAVWAPSAERVSIVGDFNRWDGRCHPMRVRGSSGVWELFVPGLPEGSLYKFEIRNRHTGHIHVKSDPYAKCYELRPNTASVVMDNTRYAWQDQDWMQQRASRDWQHAPMSIYEVHLGSWQRNEQGEFLSYRELAEQMIPYVQEMGFTHIELLPVTEHPLDASWGYQTTGYYAPTRRHGDPDDFRYFVDRCHQAGIGVILDWVPAHFPRDEHALARFDGTALYEHQDPRKGEHRDWGTFIYNYERHEVKNFLIGSALYWLESFHIDGLRVDAVASLLYLDYSREAGDWLPNIYGGNENLEAIAFIRELNSLTQSRHPGALMIAEESTAWPQVSRPTWLGGLGFAMKWNMGWMHDTLQYLTKDPVHRHYHHDQLTFGLLYAFTENFVLPFSHDEVVHGKGSMRYKMPGDEWQQFANLRLLYTYMFTYPGKKLLFMGSEFGQGPEWDHDKALDWYVLNFPLHQGLKTLVSDLNRLYRQHPALYQYDFEQRGFEWIDCHDAAQSVLSYLRHDDGEQMVVVINFTPVVRKSYRIGVPCAGQWREVINSDSTYYGGSNVGNDIVYTDDIPWMNRPASVQLTLPPLAAIVLKKE